MSTEEEDRAAAEAAGLTREQQTALTAYHSEEHFLLLHRPQLESMQLPKHLWPLLYAKIYREQFDALDTFAVARSDEEGQEGFFLIAEPEEGVNAGEDVWIFEQAWQVPEADAVAQLRRTPALVDRLWALMDLDRRVPREEAEEEARKRAEVEEQRRREDRKEDEREEAERQLREAEEQKQRERTRALEEEDWANDEAVGVVIAQTQSSRDAAVRALQTCRGDLVDAINCITNAGAAAPPTPSSSSPSTLSAVSPCAAPLDPSSLSDDERRAQRVWDALFTYRYIHSFYTTQPREERRPLTAADVTTWLYVEDEVGSAVTAGPEPTARVCALMCVTLNTSFSVMWLTAHLDQGDEVVRRVRARPALRKTREWSRA